MNASRYADSPPPTNGPPANERPFTAPSQKPMTQPSDPPAEYPNPSSSYPYPNFEADPMDQFSQTRAPDDLFDDDFTPIAEPAPQPPPQRVPAGPRDRGASAQRGQGERAGRGRGGRRGGMPGEPQDRPADREDQAATPKEAPREQAVRGDRSGTGGIKQPKLTEDELSARLEKVKIKNAAREASHKRAQADEASFQQREQVAHVKRQQEQQNRQVLEGERERNRLRKLKAVQGREWDAEKKNEDYNSSRGGRSSQFSRGAYGGVAYTNDEHDARGGGNTESSEFSGSRGGFYQSDSRGRGRGRDDGFRGRGGGRGRGRGRGGQYSGPPDHQSRTVEASRKPDFGAESEFPALPANHDVQGGDAGDKTERERATSPEAQHPSQHVDSKPNVDVDTSVAAQASGEKDGTWADQMNTPVMTSEG